MTEQILRDNLRKIIEAQAPRDSHGRPSVRGWALARDIDPTAVYRVLNSRNSPSLAAVDQLAAACGLAATWQLLTPDFDPDDPPAIWLRASERDVYLRILDARAFGTFAIPSPKQTLIDDSGSAPQRRRRK